jgi:coenzyme F420-reducing hydrogenase delta subunit
MLTEIGVEPERVHMVNVSAAMASEFVNLVNQIGEELKTLGPNPLREKPKDSYQ